MDNSRENEDDQAFPIANPVPNPPNIQNPPNNQNLPPNQVRVQQLPNADFASYQKLPVEQYGGDPVEFVDFMTDYFMYAKAYG